MSAAEGKPPANGLSVRHNQQQHKEKHLRLRGEGEKKNKILPFRGSGLLRGTIKCVSNTAAAVAAASAGTRSAASRVVRDGRLGSNCLE